MSVELYVYLRSSEVPTRDAWQQAIEAAGIDLVLDAGYDVGQDSGFFPARMGNYDEDTGFEFYLDPIGDDTSFPEGTDVTEQLADRDVMAAFRFSFDLRECVAATYAAAALTQLVNGFFCEEDGDELLDGAQALELARQTDRDVAQHLQRSGK